MTDIRTRPPTGLVPWPLILIEGAEKTGKSFLAAQFTACQRLGAAYWLDLGEGAADEYAAIDGAHYLVLVHDGSWPEILGQVEAVHTEAARAAGAGQPPVVLVIDSMTAEWDLLKDWVGQRARTSPAARKKLAQDPDADIKPAMNLWNDAAARHGRLMHLLMTFPGIAIVTARGKDVAALDDNGRPTGQRDYRVEGHKNLAFDCSAWVRLSREHHPQVVGVRSVRAGIRPGVDRPLLVPNLSLDWLVFEHLGCDPQATHTRDHVPGQAVDYAPMTDHEITVILGEITAATSIDAVAAIGRRLGGRVAVTPRGQEVVAAAQARKAELS